MTRRCSGDVMSNAEVFLVDIAKNLYITVGLSVRLKEHVRAYGLSDNGILTIAAQYR